MKLLKNADVWGVMVTIRGNGAGDQSSKPWQGCLHCKLG